MRCGFHWWYGLSLTGLNAAHNAFKSILFIMADVYYNLDDSLSVELKNIDEVILFRNVLEASVGRTQNNADYKIIKHVIDELTYYINQEQENMED